MLATSSPLSDELGDLALQNPFRVSLLAFLPRGEGSIPIMEGHIGGVWCVQEEDLWCGKGG